MAGSCVQGPSAGQLTQAHEHVLMGSPPVLEIVRKSWLCEGITGTRNRLLFPGLILQTDPIRSQHRASSVPELRVGSWN